MPELPEVETVVRDLRPLVVGRCFNRIEVGTKTLRRAWSTEWDDILQGRTVQALLRRGKWILVDLDGPWLLIHLGMTGQFTCCPAHEPRQNHTHVVFTLHPGGQELRFRDIRRFGSLTLFADRAELNAFLEEGKLGPEPFEVDKDYFRQALGRTSRNLKAFLLDQRVLAGVGNIYADEALFEARLHPARLGKDLNKRQADALRQAIPTVLNRAIALRGSSIRNYVGGSGLQGGFQNEFKVYGRQGKPCPRCRTPIERTVLAGRSTHFCPRCQK